MLLADDYTELVTARLFDFFRVRDGYLSRLAAAARSGNPPGVESLASSTAAHLLDLGFSNGFLHRWLRTLVMEDTRGLHVGDVLEEGAALCTAPLRNFEIMIPFVAVPLGYLGPMPEGWHDAHAAAAWLSEADPVPQGDLRQLTPPNRRSAGAVVVEMQARDEWSAVEAAAELVAQAAARVAVGSRMGRLQPKGVGWVRNDANQYPLRPRTRVHLRSLKTAEDVFKVPVDPADAVVYDALEIFSALESGTRGAALTGGWAQPLGLGKI